MQFEGVSVIYVRTKCHIPTLNIF